MKVCNFTLPQLKLRSFDLHQNILLTLKIPLIHSIILSHIVISQLRLSHLKLIFASGLSQTNNKQTTKLCCYYLTIMDALPESFTPRFIECSRPIVKNKVQNSCKSHLTIHRFKALILRLTLKTRFNSW